MSRARTSSRIDPVQSAIEGIPVDALECRRKRAHDWDGFTVVNGSGRLERLVTEECRRCRSHRSAWWRDDGIEWTQLTGWRSDYVDGYLIPGGLPDGARRRLAAEHYRHYSD